MSSGVIETVRALEEGVLSDEYDLGVKAENVLFIEEGEETKNLKEKLQEEIETRADRKIYANDHISMNKKENYPTGINSTVLGKDCGAADNAFAAGVGVVATGAGTAAVGLYNECDKDYLFTVGNGTGDEVEHRHNAFVVDKNGNAYAEHFYTFDGSSAMESISKVKIDSAEFPCNGGSFTLQSGSGISLSPFAIISDQIHNFGVEINANTLTPSTTWNSDDDMIVIGDSYLQGYHPDGPAQYVTGWGDYVKSYLNVPNENYFKSFLGGTGFVAQRVPAQGASPETFGTLFKKVINQYTQSKRDKKRVKLIIFGGGYNDLHTYDGNFYTNLCNNMKAIKKDVQENFPNAKVVVAYLANSGWNSIKNEPDPTYYNALLNMRSCYSNAAAQCNFTCFDWVGLNLKGNTAEVMLKDGRHPDEMGQALLARSIVEGLSGVKYLSSSFNRHTLGGKNFAKITRDEEIILNFFEKISYISLSGKTIECNGTIPVVTEPPIENLNINVTYDNIQKVDGTEDQYEATASYIKFSVPGYCKAKRSDGVTEFTDGTVCLEFLRNGSINIYFLKVFGSGYYTAQIQELHIYAGATITIPRIIA